MNNIDPMLTENADKYRENIAQKVRDMIEQDRAERRQPAPSKESPTMLIGASGMSNGLIQSI